MSYLFLFARFYPVIAVGSAFIFFELALYFRRSGRAYTMVFCFFLIFIALITAALWLGFRGDQNSDDWVKYLLSLVGYVFPQVVE